MPVVPTSFPTTSGGFVVPGGTLARPATPVPVGELANPAAELGPLASGINLPTVGPTFGQTGTQGATGALGGIFALTQQPDTQGAVSASLNIAGAFIPGLNILAAANTLGALVDRFVFAPRRAKAERATARTFFRQGFGFASRQGLPPTLAARFGVASALGRGANIPQSIDDLLGDLCPPGAPSCPAGFDPATGSGLTLGPFANVFSPSRRARTRAQTAASVARFNARSVTSRTRGLVPSIFQRSRLN